MNSTKEPSSSTATEINKLKKSILDGILTHEVLVSLSATQIKDLERTYLAAQKYLK